MNERTGSIQGTVYDPTNAAVKDTKLTIISKTTDLTFTITTNSSGIYNSGGLIPGDYQVRVEHDGFTAASFAVTVLVGATANGNVTLEIAGSSEAI
jgi:hypothetical protein